MKKALLLVIPLLALVLLGCPKRQALTPWLDDVEPDIVVADDGSGDYRTIGAALEAADDGDVILVKPGKYEEEVEVEGDDIELLGSGPDRTTIDADGEYAAVSFTGDDCTVAGFTLSGGESHGAYVKDGHHHIEYCLVRNNGDRGIYISNMFGNGTAEVLHCTVVNNEVSGIYSIDDDSETEISYCIIAGNGRGIVSDEDKGNMTITYNVMDNSEEDFDRVSPGVGNVTGDPKFVGDDDFRVKPGSPAVDIDGEGSRAGCF
jgi:hypothetical protein